MTDSNNIKTPADAASQVAQPATNTDVAGRQAAQPATTPADAASQAAQQANNAAASQASQPAKTTLKDKVMKVVEFIVPLALSVTMITWLLHKCNLTEIWHIITHGCDFFWIFCMMILTMLSQMIRGIRWGIQLRAAGVPRMPVAAESSSIFGAYALNLFMPYLGEGWRCVYVSRREKVKLSTVVGTDLGDRGSDAVVVVMLLLLSLVLAHPVMLKFFSHYKIGTDIDNLVTHRRLWIMIGAALAVISGLLYIFRQSKVVKNIEGSAARMWDGFKVIFHMKGRGLYVVLTFGIWICYYLETYSCFNAFDFTRELITRPGTAWGLIPGLVVFVFGSMSIAVPSNGGLGPWNLAVMFALSLYGIGQNEGMAYSMVFWSCQSIMQLGLGLFAALYIIRSDRKRKKLATDTAPKPSGAAVTSGE